MKNAFSKYIESLNPKEFIIVKGAKVNNLKNIDLVIPRNNLIVITGVSGSGKTSLAFDTLFAEGHRLYVESLSSYARQFLGKIEKPSVDYIKGLSPAIAIEQKSSLKNPRSTVGTITEIYDYLKILYARLGVTFSPKTGEKIKKYTVTDIVEYINSLNEGAKIIISFPLKIVDVNIYEKLRSELVKGFTRLIINNEIINIEDFLTNNVEKNKQFFKKNKIFVLVDRIIVNKNDNDNLFRIADSVQTALYEGDGYCAVNEYQKDYKIFSDKLESDGTFFEEPSIGLFNFNTPYGACKKCNGIGSIFDIDENKVIPNNKLSVYEGAILPWQSPLMSKWLEPLIKEHNNYNFPINIPYKELNEKQKNLLWKGFKKFKGLNNFFLYLKTNSHKIQYRIMYSKYKGKTICFECLGTRLRNDVSYIKIDNKSIIELLLMPITELLNFFNNISLTEHQTLIGNRIIKEINNRLNYLQQVGLEYLTLSRSTATLSGGELQRVNLATSLGSTLIGTIYILDEPTVGLHPRDTEKLTNVLVKLKDCGNTVIVVEHEEEVMKRADQLIDIGPEAGSNGGNVMFQGTLDELLKANNTYTSKYLNGSLSIPIPKFRRKWNHSFTIKGVRENNLKDFDVEIPLGVMTVITGISGSGKSTLVKKIIFPAIGETLYMNIPEKGRFDKIEGNFNLINELEFINQNPIGKSSRSNPITYTKAYELVRTLFANQPLAIERNYDIGKFSFNVEGGRCETCLGEGIIKIEMQFMADITLTCEECNGQRFKESVLEVKYKDKNINDVLKMTIDDAIIFFSDYPEIIQRLKPVQDVGLGYICLGQSSSSLSGGESQRLKLASYLKTTRSDENKHCFFIFDEPTTGLHFRDISKLLKSLNRLVEMGNTVLIVEHNLDVIKSADWIIDMGPEGGEKGGQLLFQGTPENMIKLENNITAKFLKAKML